MSTNFYIRTGKQKLLRSNLYVLIYHSTLEKLLWGDAGVGRKNVTVGW